jgi:hypothetical protein
MDVLLAILLVMSFTCIGSIALWAATSSRHWFARTAVVLGILAPLLLVPAHEVFAAFAVQCATVAVGVFVFRRSSPQPRFSLSASLLITALLAIIVPIAVRMPALNGYGWTTVALNGIAGGLSTLVGGWYLVGRRKWLVWPAGIIFCIAIGVALSFFDWLIPSIVNWTHWPPDPTPTSPFPKFGVATRPVIAWFFIPVLIATFVAFVSAYWRAVVTRRAWSAETEHRSPSTTRRIFQLFSFVFVISIFAAMPVYVLYKLLTPDPIPEARLPNPNGYEDLIAASRLAASTAFNGLNFDYDTASQKALAVEVAKSNLIYDRFALGLSRDTRVPVNYSFSAGSLPLPDISNFRSLARAIDGKARLVEMEGRFGDAAHCCLDGITFGQAVGQGGLLIDALVGNACAGISMYRLYHERDKIPVQELGGCISRLQKIDSTMEPFDDVWYRDRVWSQRTNGWHGHLTQLLNDIVKKPWVFIFIRSDQYPFAYVSHRVKLRLLILELALARFHKENGRWPASIEELTPKYTSAIPVDPFDPKSLPLKYRKTDTGYIAYSVGANRIDDGGAPPPGEGDFSGLPLTGDFRLDIQFKPYDDTSGTNSPAADESQSGDGEVTNGNEEARAK